MRLITLIGLGSLLPISLAAIGQNTKTARPHSTQAAKPVRMPARASAPSASADLISYRDTIEPFLKANCGSCHSADKHSGGFVVETPESLRKGGTRFGTKVIVPGKAANSALIAYLRGAQQPRMPLNGAPVAETTIKTLEAWITQGAKVDVVRLKFPYAPVTAKKVPAVKNAAWCRNPIDNFILAKLESKGLAPAPPASKIALIRRVFTDLIGVPPAPQETEAFLNDRRPDAYTKIVDRLLADPRYGERWGRHWLDLVRYAETHGFESDGVRPRAWRYRDYVIRAFNSDKPYDRFIQEQIAGDELFPEDPDAVIATGYARLGPWDELSREPEQRWQDYLNDVTDTTGSVVLGLTVGCARCHDHKYDRVSQKDYYRMQSFFVGTQWTEARLPETVLSPETKRRLAEIQARTQTLTGERDVLLNRYRERALAEKQKKARPGEKVSVDDGDIDRLLTQKDRETRDRLNGEIGQLEEEKRPIEPVAEAITDKSKNPPVSHILLRGNLRTPGPEVTPGFVASLCGSRPSDAAITPPARGNTTGRRAALARWLTSPDNPLTARVIVNRVWQHHFGRGLLNTPSDFGLNGDRPSHPELLDWLAKAFSERSDEKRVMSNEKKLITHHSSLITAFGYSLKSLHRLILLSSAYQQSTQALAAAKKLDPDNRLLSHANRNRLDGEALRDSILTVSWRLNLQSGGPSVYPKVSDEVLETGSTHKWGSSPEEQGLRRTIYVFQRRSLTLPIIEAFDGADMNNTCPRRAVTTIAPQALALFNGEFSREEARFFAERVHKEAGEDRGKQIERAYQIALARLPTAAQKATALEFLKKKAALILSEKKNSEEAERRALADFCHVLINTNEFLYLD